MDKLNLAHPKVRAAISAFQEGRATEWAAAFATGVELFDDGNPRDFARFSHEALGHERFTAIETVEENGLGIIGRFHSDQWGDFQTFFRFRLGADGRFDRLDIGQA